jgi:hypothetical protein
MTVAPDQLQPRALCALLDVTKRVPGYEPGDDETVDDILNDLIVQESRDFVETTGREIVAMSSGPRVFDLTVSMIGRRSLPIGDAASITQVELFDYDGTTSLGVIASNLYVLQPRVRDDWQPIRRLWFPYRPVSAPVLLAPGRTLEITATWGFPAIPDTVRRAVATLVIFRYLNDAAAAGTVFADAANREDFNLGASLKVALDARDRLGPASFA